MSAARRPRGRLATVHKLPAPAPVYCTLVVRGGKLHGAETYRPGAMIMILDEDKLLLEREGARVVDLAEARSRRAPCASVK